MLRFSVLGTGHPYADGLPRLSDRRGPLRIAHVTATFPPYYGGTGNVCYHNARVLAARGHDVHVFTADWAGAVDDPAGVHVHRLRPRVRIGNATLIPGLIGKLQRFDLVHLHYPFIGGGDLAACLSRLHRQPLVLTYHNDLRAAGFRGGLFSAYERTAARMILAAARRIGVVATDYARNSPLLQSLTVPPPNKLLVEIPNGVDTTHFRPDVDGSGVRARFGIGPDAVVVLFVGVLDTAHDFKRVDVLLRAIKIAGDSRFRGLIVGGGDLLPRYQELAAELDLGEQVAFAGALRHEELPPYYAAADMLVLPSDATESFGIVLIEAMATGKPVIASDLPGVRDVVSPGRDGFLVAPGDAAALCQAMQRVASMPASSRADLGAAGRAKVEARYSWDRVGDLLEHVYYDVLTEVASDHPSRIGAVDGG